MSRRGCRIYVGYLSDRTDRRELESTFGRFGRITEVDMKRRYAFINYSSSRDAEDAIYDMHKRTLDGSRIIVEWA
jgi:RNA recognition motif-containing protein